MHIIQKKLLIECMQIDIGNGDENSGDGFKYCGKGCLQTTFKDNYEALKNALPNDDLINNPEILTIPEKAFISACYFWNSHDLNKYADQQDIHTCTKIINGGR